MTTLKDNSDIEETFKETDEDSALGKMWKWLMKTWLYEKRYAKKTDNWDEYIWFLKELKSDFGKLYAGFTNQAWIDLFDKVFETLSCELKESIIKSNNKGMSEAKKKKSISEMTDEEVTKAYQKGTQWLRDRALVTGSDKNEMGELYNDDEWQTGLKRIEKLEDEMRKRGLAI